MFENGTSASSKGGRMFTRTIAHGAFYAGAGSTLKVLAHMPGQSDIEQPHRTVAQ